LNERRGAHAIRSADGATEIGALQLCRETIKRLLLRDAVTQQLVEARAHMLRQFFDDVRVTGGIPCDVSELRPNETVPVH
jgi:hypothetical protein